MPFCQDRATKALNAQGYSLVRYPRANIAPLDLVAGESAKLDWLGPLSDVWTARAPAPAPVEINSPNFTYQRSGEFAGSIGVRILQGLIRNVGGNVKGNVTISSTLSFTYEAPKQYSIAPTAVGKILSSGDLDVNHPLVRRYVDEENALDSRLYVITEVLRARKLLVRVTAADEATAAADAQALQGLASGSASVSSKDERHSEIAFDGSVDLTFAFRAFELGYVNGRWDMLGAAPDDRFMGGGSQSAGPARFGDTPMVQLRGG